MKTFLFFVLILISLMISTSAFAKDTFFVETTDAVYEEDKKVSLLYTFTNSDSMAISHIDISPHESIELENIELPLGWGVIGKNKKSIRLGTTGFFPNTSIKIRFKVKLADPKRTNIFQVREPVPLFILTVYYANNSNKQWSIQQPFIRNMR